MTADHLAAATDAANPTDAAFDSRATTTILICRCCRVPGEPDASPRPGSALLAEVQAAAQGTDLVIKGVGCLGNCKRGISAAMLRDGGWSYVFGDLTPDSAADIVAGAKLFSTSSDPFMPFRARPEPLKRGLIARLPTFETLKDLP